jgi:pyruvate formate lyase activating enzyme
VHRANVVMRVPLIPGFNDGDNNLKATAHLARRLSREGILKGVHLLKFHSMASSKSTSLERKYSYQTTPPYTPQRFDHIIGTFRSEYPDAEIGG